MTDAIIRSNAISRSAALSMMDEYIDLARDEELHHAMCVVAAGLAELPTLDVTPVVHARWIYYGDVNEDGNCEANCSACGAGDTHRPDLKNAVPYCWNCGARMDGEEDASD